EVMRLKIALAFLVVSVVLRFKSLVALSVSALATLFILFQYALWYLDTNRWLRELHVSDFSQLPIPSEFPNFGGLYLSTPWDVVVLVFTAALFLWEIRVVIAPIMKTRRGQHSSEE